MANVSQSVLRGRGRIPPVRKVEVVTKMPEAVGSDVVAAQRKSFKETEEDIQEAIKSTDISAKILRSKALSRGTLSRVGKIKREAQAAASRVMKAKTEFETEVAEKAPGKAQEGFRSEAISKAEKEVKEKIRSQIQKIEKYRVKERKYKDRGNDVKEQYYDDRQEEETASLNVFKKALSALKSGNKSTSNLAIQKFFSGHTTRLANYQEDREQYFNERSAAKKKWEKEHPQFIEVPTITSTFVRPPAVSTIKKQLFGDYKKGTILEFLPKLEEKAQIARVLKKIREFKPDRTVAPPRLVGEIPEISIRKTDVGKFKVSREEREAYNKKYKTFLKRLDRLEVTEKQFKDEQSMKKKMMMLGVAPLVDDIGSFERNMLGFGRGEDLKMIPPKEVKEVKMVKQDVTSSRRFAEPGQVYIPALGGFAQPDRFGQGTAIISPATIAELKDFDKIREQGSPKFIIDVAKKGVKKYQETVVEPLSKSKTFKEYEKFVVQPLSKRIIQPVFGAVGIGAKKYEETVVRKVQEALPGLKDSPLGRAAEAKRIVEKLNPEQDVVVGFGANKRIVKAKRLQGTGLYEFSKNIITGEVEASWTGAAKKYEETVIKRVQEALPGIKDTPVSKILGQEERLFPKIGKAAKITTEFAPYLIPGVYGADVGARAGEAATGGKFGGEEDIIQFGIKNPIDVALVGAFGAAKGFKAIKGIGADKIIYNPEYSKYLVKDPKRDRKLVELIAETKKVQSKTLKQPGARIKVGQRPSVTELDIGAKIKGRTQVRVSKETGNWLGSVKETHKTASGKLNTYTGTASYKKGVYRDVVKLGGDLKKVTTIDSKGKAVVEIFKGNKVVTRLVNKNVVIPHFNLKKGKDIQDIIISKTKGGTEPIKTTRLKEFKTTTVTGKGKPTTGFVEVQVKRQIEAAKIAKQNLKKSVEQMQKIKDAIKTKPKIGLIDDPFRQVKVRTPQQPIYGTADDVAKQLRKQIDISRYIQTTKGKQLIKATFPKTDRLVEQITTRKVTLQFGDDLLSKAQIKAAQAKASALAKAKAKSAKLSKAADTRSAKAAGAAYKKAVQQAKSGSLKFIDKSTGRSVGEATRGISGLTPSNRKIAQQLQQVFKVPPKGVREGLFVLSPGDITGVAKFGETPSAFFAGVSAPSKAIGGSAAIPISLAGVAKGLSDLIKTETKFETKLDTKPDTKSDITQDTGQGVIQLQPQAQPQAQPQDQPQETGQDQPQFQRPGTSTETGQTPREVIKQITTPRTRTPTPARPVITKTPLTFLDTLEVLEKKKGKKKGLTTKKEFFIPEAKRNDKWVKLAKTGLLKQSAEGRGARATDKTIAAQFRITPTGKGNPNIVDNYFAFNKKKFRGYKIVKGKKVPMINTWIEKKGKSRLDSPGEKQGLTIAKFMKKKGWASKPQKTKKKRPKKLNI